MQGYPEYSPALGGLYVLPAYRRQGLATALVQAVMHLAEQEQHKRIYVSTATANSILERLGWEAIDTAAEGHKSLIVYQYEP